MPANQTSIDDNAPGSPILHSLSAPKDFPIVTTPHASPLPQQALEVQPYVHSELPSEQNTIVQHTNIFHTFLLGEQARQTAFMQYVNSVPHSDEDRDEVMANVIRELSQPNRMFEQFKELTKFCTDQEIRRLKNETSEKLKQAQAFSQGVRSAANTQTVGSRVNSKIDDEAEEHRHKRLLRDVADMFNESTKTLMANLGPRRSPSTGKVLSAAIRNRRIPFEYLTMFGAVDPSRFVPDYSGNNPFRETATVEELNDLVAALNQPVPSFKDGPFSFSDPFDETAFARFQACLSQNQKGALSETLSVIRLYYCLNQFIYNNSQPVEAAPTRKRKKDIEEPIKTYNLNTGSQFAVPIVGFDEENDVVYIHVVPVRAAYTRCVKYMYRVGLDQEQMGGYYMQNDTPCSTCEWPSIKLDNKQITGFRLISALGKANNNPLNGNFCTQAIYGDRLLTTNLVYFMPMSLFCLYFNQFKHIGSSTDNNFKELSNFLVLSNDETKFVDIDPPQLSQRALVSSLKKVSLVHSNKDELEPKIGEQEALMHDRYESFAPAFLNLNESEGLYKKSGNTCSPNLTRFSLPSKRKEIKFLSEDDWETLYYKTSAEKFNRIISTKSLYKYQL